MNFKSILAAASGLMLVALPVSVEAHGSMKPQHGGLVQMSGETVVELVAGAKGVDVYVSEEDEPVAVSGLTGKLTVTANGAKKDTPLLARKGNHFAAPGLKIAKGSKVVVVLVSKSGGAKIFTTFQVK